MEYGWNLDEILVLSRPRVIDGRSRCEVSVENWPFHSVESRGGYFSVVFSTTETTYYE